MKDALESSGAAQQDRVPVLYVGGMPRSGSTLLTWMLGQLPGHVAVGELFYLWTAGLVRDQLCGCGRPFSECPFWQEVGEEAFGGWDNVDHERVTALLNEVDRTSRIPHVLLSRFAPRFRRALQEYLEITDRVYRAASRVAGDATIVDGSKRPSLAYLLRASRAVDLRVVQIVRDPRGVVQSWSKQVALPPGGGSRGYLKVRPTRQITRRWVTVNAMIRATARMGVPLMTVRYEDLVSDPRGVVGRIAAFSGVAPEPDPLAFIDGSQVHVEPAHMVEGGRVRFSPSPLVMRADETWRLEMPAGRKRVVDLVTGMSRRRYGYR